MDRMAWPARRALAGWLGLLSPASSVIASIANIGFIGFFVFMLTMGIALLRRHSKADQATRASNTNTKLTKGIINPFRDSSHLALEVRAAAQCRDYRQLTPVVGLVMLARTRRFGCFAPRSLSGPR